MSSPKKLLVSRVAVIGAGASGLAAVRYLLAENKFTKVQAFEQRAVPGGIWNHTALCKEDNFSLPRVHPSSEPDEAVAVESGIRFEFVTPVHDDLETNIPHSLMNFTDLKFPAGTALFPRHEVVSRYLKRYAEGLEPYIQYQAQVLNVRKLSGAWEVEILDLKANTTTRHEFDAIVIASGHFNDPFVPNTPGLVEFDKIHPGAVLHSKFYRRPNTYADKKVVIIGNSASGVDLKAQVSQVARLPVIVAEKEKDGQAGNSVDSSSVIHLPEVTQFIPDQRSLKFADGHVETQVDAVIFCTGFHYSYPFLQSLDPSVIDPKGGFVGHLWENILYSADPTLAFLSVPQRGIPFPLAEAQSSVICRMWSGRLDVPSESEMESWITEAHHRKGEGKAIHLIHFPEDVEYIRRLHRMSETATRAPELGLENGGAGKQPLHWGPWHAWLRGKVGEIKRASRLVGDDRHKIMSPEELGFYFEEPKTSGEGRR